MSKRGVLTFSTIVFIAILGFLLYGNSIKGSFILDDDDLIKNNVYIKQWSNILKVLTRDTGSGSGVEQGYYRPVLMLSLMADCSLWGLNPKGYHVTTILLHIIATLTLYWLVKLLFNDRSLCLLTSLLFLVFPTHAEDVAYITGRADSLALLFMLLSFAYYIKSEKRASPIGVILMGLFCALALLSKENAIILPALLLLYHYSFKKRVFVTRFFLIAAICLGYILLRMMVIESSMRSLSAFSSAMVRLPGFFVALFNYIGLLIFPVKLHMLYGVRVFTMNDPRAIGGVAALAALLFYAVKKRDAEPFASFCILWFFVALLPFSNVYPASEYMAERYLYVPSIGFFLLVSNGLLSLYRLKKLKVLAVAITVLLLGLYSALTFKRTAYWKDPVAFYEQTIQHIPDSFLAYNNLGISYSQQGKKDKAIEAFKKAIEINPRCASAYTNLGAVYHELGRMSEAAAAYKKAIEIDPRHVKAYNNLGIMLYAVGRRDEAALLYRKAISINPDYAMAYYNLGVACYDTGKKDEAIRLYKRALSINPDYINVFINLGVAYNDAGQTEDAIESYMTAIKKDPACVEAYYNLGYIYGRSDRRNEAIWAYEMAIKYNPSYAKAYNNLGVLYFRSKEYDKAISYLDKATYLGYPVPQDLLNELKPYRK